MRIMFWALDATVLFSLSLLYIHQGYHRKNQAFTLWLCCGVLMQLAAAWGLAAGSPRWMAQARAGFDIILYVLAAAVLVLAVMRRGCPVNRSLLWGLGAMLVLNVLTRLLGSGVEPAVRAWLRNIAFFGPAIFLLIALSNIRLDLLPLWVDSAVRLIASGSIEEPAIAAMHEVELGTSRRYVG
ncbi:MAG TPA: hypothetical protein VKM93_08415 [Terriglobia bacterium]|nr:hypothetical protein [Terriglobia bacterium]